MSVSSAGGYTGLSASLHLAQAGASVVLLEARTPGWGASGRNGGQIIPYWKVEHGKVERQYGTAMADRTAEWARGFVSLVFDLIKAHQIDCNASVCGWIQPAHSYELLRIQERRAKEYQAQGVDAYVVEASKARELLGTEWYKGAFVDRRGARLHPLSYARGLARAAVRAGARVCSMTPALELRKQGDRWSVATPTGSITARIVVLCTNAYADADGFKPLIDDVANAIVPLNSYMIATQPLAAALRQSILPNGETAADFKKLMHHFRMETDGRLLFGGRGGLRSSDDSSAYAPLIHGLATIFPHLKDVPIEYRWSGKVAITADGSPHFHRPAHNVLVATGCNGRGLGMCTAAGKLLSELIGGLPDSKSPMPITRLRALPFHRLRLLGAQAAVWYKGWQDRRDYHRTM
jgi:glycine/D-amino acid oxidase-like deaminating enzyme